MEKRKRVLKRTIVLFWKGLTGIIAATAEWFTVILGMKDESKYGKFLPMSLKLHGDAGISVPIFNTSFIGKFRKFRS